MYFNVATIVIAAFSLLPSTITAQDTTQATQPNPTDFPSIPEDALSPFTNEPGSLRYCEHRDFGGRCVEHAIIAEENNSCRSKLPATLPSLALNSANILS
jgi:hypothetical protein